jgi:APA family basic amino acid/polyamine antiporter
MGLKRVLGAGDATWLVAGSMVGAGIFLAPGLVAGHLPGVAMPLLAWMLGGLLALCGAMVYGELGARIPRAGADYQYLARAYGPVWGFLTGWAAFTVTFSAAVAAMVIVALDYLQRSLPVLDQAPTVWSRFAAPVVVVALTWANTVGARVSGRVTALATGVPVIVLIGLYGFGLVAGDAATSWPEQPLARPAGSWILALGAAMIPVFFTYTGWNAAAYVAGEIREPGRNLARALVLGTALVTLLYLVINLVLLAMVPAERLAGSTTAGAEAARLLLGGWGERLLSLVIAVAVLGTANVTLMAGSRIYYAMAADGLGPRPLARINRFGVPGAALWSGGAWSAVLAAVGDVGVLVNWTSLAILLLSSLTVTTLFVLRRREGADAPFRCPGYPLTPLVYLVASLGVACASALHDPVEALKGLLLVGAGLPVYLFFRRGLTGSSPAR